MASCRIHIGLHLFGAGNIGDDLMMAGFLLHMESRGIAAELTCCIAPESFNNGTQQSRFPQVRWLPYSPADREECIKNCDVWLGLGNTPFQLDSGPWSLDHLAGELSLCKKHRKPMFFLCTGMNDSAAMQDPRTREILDYATHISTRDDATAEIFARVGGTRKIESAADLAHLWLRQHAFGPPEPETWACLLHFENPALFQPAALAAVSGDLHFHPARWLVQEVREWPGTELANYKLLDPATRLRLELRLPDYQAPQVAALLLPWGTPETMISSRYHGAVAAAWMGANLVIVARNEKLRGLSRQFGALELADITDPAKIRRTMDQSRSVPPYHLKNLAARAEYSCDQFLSLCGLQPAAPPAPPANPVAANFKAGHDSTAIERVSEFSRAIHKLFAAFKPKRLIETGTFLGQGSTLILCEALRDAGLSSENLVSIEVNPDYHGRARKNLAAGGFRPRLLCGLSVPRLLLPTQADIQRETLDQPPDPSIFIDHDPAARVTNYFKETDFPEAPDDLLGQALRNFDYSPDFVMLDSAGHMGFVEFQYVLPLIRRPCYFALDDVFHVKHFRSLAAIQKDPRFKILELSHEKFGFCLARFTP